MKNEERATNRLMRELEDADWDMSEETLENVARRMKEFFKSPEESREFVESHASYLFRMMEEESQY